jgi:hypothetical protein
MQRALARMVVPAFVGLAACVPSYTFSAGPADGAPGDASIADSPGADAPPPPPDASTDAAAPDANGADANGARVTIDHGFPKSNVITNAAGMTLSVTLDVPSGGRMLVAVVVWGQYGGAGVWPVTFDGAGLMWTLRKQSVSAPDYANAVGVGVWTAWASTALAAQTVTATRSNDVAADAVLAVFSFAGASQTVGAVGGSVGFSGSPAPLSITLDAQAAGSFVVGGLLDGNGIPGLRGATLANTMYDLTLPSPSGNGIAVGRLIGLTSGAGPVTIGQDGPYEHDVTAGVEILAQ